MLTNYIAIPEFLINPFLSHQFETKLNITFLDSFAVALLTYSFAPFVQSHNPTIFCGLVAHYIISKSWVALSLICLQPLHIVAKMEKRLLAIF